MLEEKIERLTAEIVKLREAYEKGAKGGATTTTADAGADKKPADKKAADKKPAKTKFTAEQVKTAVIKVKDEVGEDAAKAVISGSGCSGLAALIAKPEVFDSVMAACEEALAGGGDDADDSSEDDGLGGL